MVNGFDIVWNNYHGSIVDLVEKNDGAIAEGFGGEGTGAHAYLHYNWTTEELSSSNTNLSNTWELAASFFAQKQPIWLGSPYDFLENFGSDQTALREGYYGNYSITNTEGRAYSIEESYFTRTKPLKPTDIWEQRAVGGPRNEVYMRIDGTKDQGIYHPPTIIWK